MWPPWLAWVGTVEQKGRARDAADFAPAVQPAARETRGVANEVPTVRRDAVLAWERRESAGQCELTRGELRSAFIAAEKSSARDALGERVG